MDIFSYQLGKKASGGSSSGNTFTFNSSAGTSGARDIDIVVKENVPDYAFYNSSLINSITLDDNITSIGSYAFYSPNDGKIKIKNIPNTLITLGEYAFYNCNIDFSYLPSSITEIASATFFGTNLTEFTCLGDLTSIGTGAFRNTTNLTKLSLPNVTSVPSLGSNAFNSSNIQTIEVPASLLEDFKVANRWSTYADKIVAISE